MTTRWIVSAEDTPYQSWQATLFAYSACSRCLVRPSIFIHESPQDSLKGDWTQAHRWADIFYVPKYRQLVAGVDYQPRNFVGTVIEAAKWNFKEDWLAFFDPDMIFASKPEICEEWSADEVFYGPEGARVGVPYVVETRRAAELGETWLQVLDSATRFEWELSMWAYVVAMRLLQIPYAVTNHAESNHTPATPATRPIVHYCYNGHGWSKRKFQRDPYEVFQRIPTELGVMIEGQIFQQLRELKERVYDR